MSFKGRVKHRRDVAFLVIVDLISFLFAMSIASSWAQNSGQDAYLGQYHFLVPIMLLVTFLCFYFYDLYYVFKDFRRYRQVINLSLAILTAFFVILAIFLWNETFYFLRHLIIYFYVLVFFFSILSRILFSLFRNIVSKRKAILIGYNTMGMDLIRNIKQQDKEGRPVGITVIGYINDSEHSDEKRNIWPIPYLGTFAEMREIVHDNGVSLLIYSLSRKLTPESYEFIIKEKLGGAFLVSAPSLFSAITGRLPYEQMDSSWLIEECLRGNKFSEIRIKRLFDLIFGSILCFLTLPIMLISALILKIQSKSPVFFIQERVGLNGELFNIYKLRTMEGSDIKGVGDLQERAKKNDERITPFGSFLRKYHIDEIPQFVNVMKGNMTLVGPRPEMEIFIEQCERRIPFYRLRLAVKPGLTGWAQVWHPHTTALSGYRKKFQYELYYLANSSLKLDLEILARTVLRILGHPKL